MGLGAAKPLAEAKRHAAAIAKLENFMVVGYSLERHGIDRPLEFVVIAKKDRRSMAINKLSGDHDV